MMDEDRYNIFDTHAHYNDEIYIKDLDSVLEDNLSSGVTKIINVGFNCESSVKSIELSRKYKQVYSAVGIHPEEADKDIEDQFEQLEEILKHKEHEDKIVAIGEIGLDYHYTKETRDIQIKYFKKQLSLAKRYDLPVSIHCRDSSEDMYQILKEDEYKDMKLIFHCFQPSQNIAKLVIERNYMIGLGGNITYKRNENSVNIIKSIPIEKILTETDCPYLSPVPFRGSRNESKNITFVIQKIAEIKNMKEIEVANIVYNNALQIFNIEK